MKKAVKLSAILMAMVLMFTFTGCGVVETSPQQAGNTIHQKN